MTYLSTDKLSKSYGETPLFSGLSFGISKGDKTALIAPNGTGKSTLLKILAGREVSDSGEVMTQKGIRTGYLEQEPELNPSMTISEWIARGESDMVTLIRKYEKAAERQAVEFNAENQKAFEQAAAAMDAAGAWDYEQRMKQILGVFNIHGLEQVISTLSGGERKRVALASALIDNPDLLILDEPTNHLDVEMIEWLEATLAKSNTTLLMVTHDRYFLDRVCTHILELDEGILYHHKGNYQYYLEKKAERQEVEKTQAAKASQLMKKELEWMRRGPKARTTKSKSRIQAFYETKEKAEAYQEEDDIRLEAGMARLGSKILELKDVNKRFGELVILDDFSYSFIRGERIGIIGPNGVGKSTFLKIITGEEPADSGEVIKGETIVFGHYRQKGLELDETLRVIDVIKEIAEVITLADGSSISASQFLEHFLFPPKMQYTPVEKLSGGEKRRLGLMMTLMGNPNFLILDEPTNDLDLITLQKLEEFLLNFGGCLILVSHDRFFMDKLTDHYFVFEGSGVIRDHHGTYQEYRELKDAEEQARKKDRQPEGKKSSAKPERKQPKKAKLSYSEKKELKKLEKEIANLEQEKDSVEQEMNSGDLDYKELEEITIRYGELEELIDQKTMRWLELEELKEQD
jgi:ABC transport system ATP-binding/permease protein